MNIREGLYLVPMVLPKRNEQKAAALDNENHPEQTNRIETTTLSNHAQKLRHVRMAHANVQAIKYMMSKESYGMQPDDVPSRTGCGTSIFAKQTKKPAKEELIKNTKDLTIQMDICGPIQKQTFESMQYF